MPFPGADFRFYWGQYRLSEIQEFSIQENSGATAEISRGGFGIGSDGRVVRLVSFQPVYPTTQPYNLFRNTRDIGSLHISCLGTVDIPGVVPDLPGDQSSRKYIVRHLARYEGYSCVARAGDVLRFIHSFTLLRPFMGTDPVQVRSS